MMNLTMSHPVPTFGDSFTITCYVCGMPSSKEWAQKARSRPCTPQKPYFPFLLQLSPLGGAVLREDGSTYLCAFCHASLEAQWNLYESQQVVPPPNRKYNIQKFICAVCGVETYRKRIRALPFQEFPFLEKQRQPGSITLGNNPLAIVCLDCSETLWAQSAEYDRWGLPVHKRHFNWMARPPPPEDSVEATVARLPSGETQLPRCPPIEPSLGPRSQENAAAKIAETTIASKASRSKGKSDSPKLGSSSPIPQSSRKTSLTSTTPPNLEMIGGFQNQQPPVVTVAPMSSHTTVISMRKDSLGMPPGLMAAGPPGIYPQPGTAVYPPAAAYAPYVWGSTAAASREANQRSIEAYPYGPSEAMHGPPGAWPWLPQPSQDLLRYQSYVASLQGRSMGESTVSRSPTHTSVSSPTVQPYCSGDSPSRYQSPSSAAGNPPRNQERGRSEHHRPSETITSSERPGTSSGGSSEDLSYIRHKGSPDLKTGKKSPKIHHPHPGGESSASAGRPYPTHPKKLPKEQEVSRSSLLRSRHERTEIAPPEVQQAQPTGAGESSEDQEKATRRECHIPKKRNWQQFMKESQPAAGDDQDSSKKVEEIPHHPKKKKSSLSMSEPGDAGQPPKEAPSSSSSSRSPKHSRASPARTTDPRPRSRTMDSAMDLSVGVPPISKPHSSSGASAKSSGAKFRIEYLCQSEPSKQSGDEIPSQQVADDAAPRTSVIKCAPKVPENSANQNPSDVEMADMSEDMQIPQSESISRGRSLSLDSRRNKIRRTSLDTVQEEEESASAAASGEEEQDKAEGVAQTKKDEPPTPTSMDKDGEEDDDDDKEKGKSERQAQATKMNTDDDDDDDKRKNEDLPNIEQFIKETVTELVSREKEQEKILRQSTDKQKHFLQGLGLITPDERTDLEIKSVVSRHDRKTLPPLQLRADCKLGRKIDKQLKELLLKVSIEDPSLFQERPEVEKSDFMAELGMKTAEKCDKTRREIKWRVVLMERMRREIRDATSRGVKHEWEKSEILKDFASCDLDSFFSSLSFAALLASDDDLNQEENVKEEEDKKSGSGAHPSSSAGLGGVCINYPKYIPSYAVKAEQEEEEQGQESTKSVAESVEMASSGSSLSFAEPILKIPVLPAKTRLQSESSATTTVHSDTDDSELSSSIEEKGGGGRSQTAIIPSSVAVADTPPNFTPLGSAADLYPMRLDNLIRCSSSYWEKMKQNIDEILDALESSKEDVPLEDKTSHVEKIRKHLKSQLGDIKDIEKRLRATGKTILSASRKRSQK